MAKSTTKPAARKSTRQPSAKRPASGSKAPAKRKYEGGLRELKKQDTLSRILDSALIHFAEKGFEAASVRDISADAGVTHALIRLHFGNKELLWQAAVDYLFERMNVEMALEVGEPKMREGIDGLKAFARRYVKYCARHPEHARLMLQESMHRNDRLSYAVKQHISSAHGFMYAGVKKAIANGDMPKISPVSFIYILSAASQLVFALAEEAREIYDIDVLSDEFVNQHTDTVVKLLFRN